MISQFYYSSLSSRTIVYKGMLTPEQVDAYYIELQDEKVDSALALVHSRFQYEHIPELGTCTSVPLFDS